MEILNVKNLNFRYPLSKRLALDNISFSISKGDFVTICGSTGCGKTTLLKLLKQELAPLGELSGEIIYNGVNSTEVGFVAQNPQHQIVTDKVWHELAFGLENMNMPLSVMKRRCGEIATFFGIENWYDKSVFALSGGQKQLLNLASVMVTQPQVLILDEPTAQLDPIAAENFISMLSKLNSQLGLTVIITEHRTENVIPVSNKIILMDSGKIIYQPSSPLELFSSMRALPDRIGEILPAPVRLYNYLAQNDGDFCVEKCPLNISQGREMIEKYYFRDSTGQIHKESACHNEMVALEFKSVYFRYVKNGKDILNDFSAKIYKGEIFCILGGNGSGKTTALSIAAGIYKPYSGSIKIMGQRAKDQSRIMTLLPQDIQTVFLHNTVREELEGVSLDDFPYDLGYLMDMHPYDLSGGEQQLVGLAKALATAPEILLLDEPTKGLDGYARRIFVSVMEELKKRGVTIVIVTHDVDLAALCADRCGLFFRGEMVACDEVHEFFCGNSFYTTAANLLTRGIYDGVITVKEAQERCLSSKC